MHIHLIIYMNNEEIFLLRGVALKAEAARHHHHHYSEHPFFESIASEDDAVNLVVQQSNRDVVADYEEEKQWRFALLSTRALLERTRAALQRDLYNPLVDEYYSIVRARLQPQQHHGDLERQLVHVDEWLLFFFAPSSEQDWEMEDLKARCFVENSLQAVLQQRQWLVDALQARRDLAVLESLHHRLGASSLLGQLGPDLLRKIIITHDG